MTSQLSTVLTTPHAPPFIYQHHPHTPVSSALPEARPGLVQAHLSAVEYNTPRLLYSGILRRIARAAGTEWKGGDVRTWDGFSRGLQSLWTGRSGAVARKGSVGKANSVRGSRKGKERAVETPRLEEGADGEPLDEEWNWVLVISHAERLPRILGPQWAVLTRLSELVRGIRSFMGDQS
jgi:origin recognition complex subunit 5